MIPRVITETKWIIPETEPALLKIDHLLVRNYLISRDIDRLDDDGLKVDISTGAYGEHQLTMFLCKPLTIDDLGVKGIYEADRLAASMAIFRKCVIGCRNFEPFNVKTTQSGETEVTKETLGAVGDATIIDIAAVLKQMADGADGVNKAFFLPDGWLPQRSVSLQLPANIVKTEPANGKQ